MNRRRMLELSGLAAALGLAGCMGDGGGGGDGTTTPGDGTTGGEDTTTGTSDGTETTTEQLEHVDGQSFRVPLYEDPNEFNWFFNDLGSQTFADSFDQNKSETIGQLTYENGFWGQWMHDAYTGVGDVLPRTMEIVESTPERIEFTIRDDFTWSNGDPVTSRDTLEGIIGGRLTSGRMSIEQVEEQGPSGERDTVTGFELPDEKTGVLHSEGGHFDEFVEQSLLYELLIYRCQRFPTTGVEPYEAYVDALFDTWDQYKNGEVDPWNSESDEHFRPGIQREVYGGSEGAEQYAEKFSDPANVVTNGAWQVDEILQSEIIFTPNEHHRNADRINFDEVRAEVIRESNTLWTSLNARRMDFAATNPPPHIMDEFPDTYQRREHEESEGAAILLNHNWPGLDKVLVRQGVQHALETPSICEAVDPVTWTPIQVPAGDVPHLDQFEEYGLDQNWVDENLIDYTHDPERGAQKLEEAGLTRPNDQWLLENGEPFELVFHTVGATTLGNTLAKQLTDFGIQAQMRPLEDTQFENNKMSNDLCIWPESYGSGFPRRVAQTYSRAWFQEFHAHATRWFNLSQINQTEYAGPESAYLAKNRSPEAVRHLTTMAPPVGQPDGDLQEYETMYMTQRIPNLQGEQLVEHMKKLFWLVNWHVPSWPVANTKSLTFLNTENWVWPQDADEWSIVGNGDLDYLSLHSWGDRIFADPENPKPQ